MLKFLYLIPARGGSKGIPNKNIKRLGGKPLIQYAIELARSVSSDAQICLSTDDIKIMAEAEKLSLHVPFTRPDNLATDTASTQDVILHALDWYQAMGNKFDAVVLLQPTSPFRLKSHLLAAQQIYTNEADMVVSVCQVKKNLPALIYKEKEGYMEKAFQQNSDAVRRQDAPKMFELNGAIYVINASSVRNEKISDFKKVIKMEMETLNSADIDEPLDWDWCEFLLSNEKIRLDY